MRIDPSRIETKLPEDFTVPPGARHPVAGPVAGAGTGRLQRYKVYAALAYARANGLNRTVIDSPQARFGIVTTGKSYLDVRQALDALGIDEALAWTSSCASSKSA